jgi:hypothetical protein
MLRSTCHGRGPDRLPAADQPSQGVRGVSGGEGRSAFVAVEGAIMQCAAGQNRCGRRRVVCSERPRGRQAPGEEGEGHGQLSTGRRRGEEVLREGAKRGQVPITAWPRAGGAESLGKPAERLVAGFAGKPDAECVAVRIGLRWDRNHTTRAVVAGWRAELGRARQAAFTGGTVGPAPQPAVGGHARQHAEEGARWAFITLGRSRGLI